MYLTCIDEDKLFDPLIPLFNKVVSITLTVVIFTASFKSSMAYELLWDTERWSHIELTFKNHSNVKIYPLLSCG